MTNSLSINCVPDDLVQLLRERAERNQRPLQDELLAIIEAAFRVDRFSTPLEILVSVRGMRLDTPSEGADIIRADRDIR